MEKEVKRLEQHNEASETLDRIRAVMAKHGIGGYWPIEKKLDEALSRSYPPEVDDIRAAAQQTLAKIDRLIFAAQKEG